MKPGRVGTSLCPRCMSTAWADKTSAHPTWLYRLATVKGKIMCIQTISIVVTTVVAILVAIITCGQWITNRARLRHELFDRRYTMYETIASFLASIAIDGMLRQSADREFLRNTKKAYFVFGCDPDIKNLVSEIYRLAVDLDTLHTVLDALTVADQRAANVQRQRDIKDRLQNILDSMESKFEKYLRLDH